MVLPEQWKGFIFILLADLLWGFSGTVAKYLFNNNVNSMDLTQMRLLMSFGIMLLYLGLLNRPLLKVASGDYGYFLILGVFGVAGLQFTYLNTISLTSVATAVFLEYLAPAFALVYGLVFLRERLSLPSLLALLFALAGGFLIAKGKMGGAFSVSTAGLISGLASAVFFAFYTIYGKRGLARYNPWTMLLWGFGVGAVVWCLYQPPWVTIARYHWTQLLFFGYIALFATVLPYGFFYKGLQYMSPVKTGILSSMEPVIAGVVAYFILGEVLSHMQAAGCALVLAAVITVQLSALKTVPAEKGNTLDTA